MVFTISLPQKGSGRKSKRNFPQQKLLVRE